MKSFKKYIFPSIYIEKKKRSFYRVVGKKILKNIYPPTYIDPKKRQKSNLLRKNNFKKLHPLLITLQKRGHFTTPR